MSKRFVLCFLIVFMQIKAFLVNDLNVPTSKKGYARHFTSEYLEKEENLLKDVKPIVEESQESSHRRILSSNPCSPGEYDDTGNCKPCGTMCAYCENTTGNCLGCQNDDTMTISSNKQDCECKDNTATSGTCICPTTNQWFDGTSCQACSSGEYYSVSACSSCSASGNTRVKATIKAKLTPSCCSGGKYLEISTLKCNQCGSKCGLCDDNDQICKVCSENTRMKISDTNNKECVCNGSGLKDNGDNCVCDTGNYFDGTNCVACGSLCSACDDSTGNCNTCKDNTMQIDDDKKSCKCISGTFDGTACTSTTPTCGTHCDKCDSTKCLSCLLINHLQIDPNNNQNCACENTYHWIIANNDCEQCPAGTYHDGSKCTSCSANCQSCDDLTGKCNLCVDSVKMELNPSDNTACICKGTQTLNGSTCSCASGKYFDSNDCVLCSNLCGVCADTTGECQECNDQNLMIPDPSNLKQCKCKVADLALVNGQCVCSGNKQWNGIACSICGNFCNDCDTVAIKCNTCIDRKKMLPVSGSITCACKDGLQATPSGCCSAGSYWNGSKCASCGVLCASCTNSGTCTACKDSNKMELDPDNSKVCKCKGNQLYYAVPSVCACHMGYWDGSTCQSCGTFCSECSSTKCLACQNIDHFVVDSDNSINCHCETGWNWFSDASACKQCSAGYYYNENKCVACSDNCSACSDLSGICNQCLNTSRMEVSVTDSTKCICKGNQKINESTCYCDSKYYFDGNTCVECSDLCSVCLDGTGECTTCIDSLKMIIDPSNKNNCICVGDQQLDTIGKTCTCEEGKQFNGASCSECGEFCSSCDVSGIVCNICLSTSKMTAIDNTLTCACNDGLQKTNFDCICPSSSSYYDGSQCTACGNNCTSCEDSTGACTTCKDTSRMQVDTISPKNCICKGSQLYSSTTSSCYCISGYFDGSTCQKCSALCKTCDSSKCIACQNIPNIIIDPNNPKNCKCASGYNWMTATSTCEKCSTGTYYDGNKCASCSPSCKTCLDGSGNCEVCLDSGKMTISPYDPTTCVCIGDQKAKGFSCYCEFPSFYFDGENCVKCDLTCQSCKDFTGECKTCLEPTYAIINPNNKVACKCVGGLVFDENGYSCICEDSSKYYNGVECSECPTLCKTCGVDEYGYTNCYSCEDSNRMILDQGYACKCNDGLVTTNTGCSCSSGNYFDGTTCKACGTYCVSCDDTTGICNECIDEATMEFDPNDSKSCRCQGSTTYKSSLGVCTCNIGYFDGSACQACTSLCKVCDSSKCIECLNIENLEIDPNNPAACYCSSGYNWITSTSACEKCSTGTYYDGYKCASCNPGCASCYEDTLTCRGCYDTALMITDTNDATSCKCIGNLILNGSTCSCDSNYYFDGNNCVKCSDLCSTCSDYTGECQTCIDTTKMMIDLENNKNCICIGDQILTGNTCTCDGNKKFNGANCSNCGKFCSSCDISTKTCSACIDTNRMAPISGTIKCRCNSGQQATDIGCVCPSGSYFNSTTNACTNCGDLCAECDEKTGNCILCKNTDILEISSDNLKTCKCKGNQVTSWQGTCSCSSPGYFDGATCQNCSKNCWACDSTKCSFCAYPMISDPNNPKNCICGDNYYYDSTQNQCIFCSAGTFPDGNKCSSCSTNCKSCFYGNGACSVCTDSARMMPDPNDLTSCICRGNQTYTNSACTCGTNYYFDGNNCVKCSSLCNKCIESTGECQTCIDTTKMMIDPANTKNCKCIGDQKLENNACICDSNKKFNGALCSDCGNFCETCSGNRCTYCLSPFSMTAVSGTNTCKCTDPSQLTTTNMGCSCISGSLYLSGQCVKCGDMCTTCDNIVYGCTSCVNSTTMEFDPSDFTNCKCKGNMIKDYTGACVCLPDYYFDGNNCQHCSNFCSSCNATNCLGCNDSNQEFDPNNPQMCRCKDGYGLVGNKCQKCDTGTYYDGNQCASCTGSCKNCLYSSGVCAECIDRMTIDPNDPTSCICIGNQAFNGTDCICDKSYYFDGNNCVPCSDLCGECGDYTAICHACTDKNKMILDTSNNKNCICRGDQIVSAKQCTCPGTQTFNGIKCSDCGYFCDQCTNGACNLCEDSHKMTPISNSLECECKGNQTKNIDSCSCPTGYFFDTTTCSLCHSFCASCDDITGACNSCKDSRMDVDIVDNTICSCKGLQIYNTATSQCECEAGSYFDGYTCASCGDRCAECDKTTGNCLTCIDSTRMYLNGKNCSCTGYQIADSTSCSCPAGSYFTGPQGTCISCSSNCKSCEDVTYQCTECKNNYILESSTPPHMCVCPDKTYDTGSGCSNCGTLCTSCASYSGTCSSCENIINIEVDPTNSKNCRCKTGKYYDGAACQDCGTLCATCDADKCIQCKDTNTMSVSFSNIHNCECNAGTYFDTNSNSCKVCIYNCVICSSGTTCDSCNQGYYFDSGQCKVIPCASNQYLSGSTCMECVAPCASCNSATFCNSCISNDFIFDSNGGSCSCQYGKYYEAISKTCELCGQYCGSCTGTADNCLTCIDSTMNNNAGKCTCKDKTYFDTGVCKNCVDPCANCNNEVFCLSCVDSTMILAGGICTCKDGSYYNAISHICMACDSTCATCSSSNTCLICKDPTMSLSNGVCTCPALQYFDLQLLSCNNCDVTCGKCNDALSTSCTVCRDPAMNLENGACTCPSTQYFNLTTFTCHNCIAPCEDCNSDTFCTSCLSTGILTPLTGICTCPEDKYFNYTVNECLICPGLCKTCSVTALCTSCVANTNDISNGVCTCLNGYYATGKSCAKCPSPCSTCTSSTSCTACKNHATLSSSTKKCSCNRGYGLNTTDTSGYCVATCNKLCKVCDIDNANTCSSCLENAELTGTTCACTANSAYSSTTGGCACNSGFTLTNSKCVTCKRYLASSDVDSAAFSSTWTSVSIYFNTSVDTTLDPSCSKTFTSASVALFGTGAVCSWTDKKTLKIALGANFSLRYTTLYLDGTYIVKDSTDPCTTNYQTLSVTPTATTTPEPTAVITGQSSFTLGCGTDLLTFSGDKSQGSLGGNLGYVWGISSISPANSKVSDAINGKTASSLSLDRSLFDSSTTMTLTVKLTVTNFLNVSNSASFTTSISGASALTVIFDQGNTVSMKSSTSKTLKAKVTSLCSSTTGTITWVWTYDSGPIIDSAAILANANADKLTINANSLTANTTPYVFKATASQVSNDETISGSATISITVSASPLSIGLSKTSGDVSPDRDYTINAQNSNDPDNSTSAYKDFTYKWTCLNSLDNSVCIGADGKTPLSNDTDSILTIFSSQMVKGAQWEITCTISKDTRNASATISLNILSKASDVSIEIEYKTEKYSASSNIVITAQVTAASTATLQWSETSGAITISPNYLSTMSVLASQVTAGSTYTFTLTVTYNGVSVNVEYPVTINLGAACTGAVSLSPDNGSALSIVFKLSIDGCYDKDEEDYPLAFTYLDYSNNKAYTLGYTSEINSLSTYLFPDLNNITIRVCDNLKTCNDYWKEVTVGKYTSRRLENSQLMNSYLESTVDVDNVPSTISLFCSSATIDNDLFSLMWTDLQNYIASNEITNDILENALGASYSMTTQTERMNVTMFQTFAEWLSKIIVDNPSLLPSQDNMNTIVALADNYLTYGNLTNFSELSLEGYILNIDAFLTYWEIAATKDDLVTQGAMDGTQNTKTTKIYKYRDFPTAMANKTVPFSSNRTITMPTKFSYPDADVMNMKLHYFNTSNDHSDIVMLSFAQSGTYENYVLETINETYVQFSTTDYPVTLEMPISQNISEGNEWICLFYNEINNTWIHDGCVINEIKNTSVVFDVYHFSMFKLGQASPRDPPNSYPYPAESSCEDNYAPIYILVVTLFISMVLLPILAICDRLENIWQNVEKKPTSLHTPRLTARALISQSTNGLESEPRTAGEFFPAPRPRDSIELAQGEEIVEESEQRSSLFDSDGIIIESVNIDFTQESYVMPVIIETAIQKPTIEPIDESKTEIAVLIEGHLLFGLVYFRNNFMRWARLFTLITVIILELLLEGLLLFGFENTDTGSSASTETLFADYDVKYFGYTILAIAIAIPVEIFMILAFSTDKNKAPALTAAAVAVGIAAIIGSIIGIVIFSYMFCFEWSGYWAICFLYGILIQIFIIETFYMISRYFIIQMASQETKTKT